jgi:hypothetical protein
MEKLRDKTECMFYYLIKENYYEKRSCNGVRIHLFSLGQLRPGQ